MRYKVLLFMLLTIQTLINAQDKYDATLYLPSNGKAYFFKGDKYYRYDFKRNKVDVVRTIGKDGWIGL